MNPEKVGEFIRNLRKKNNLTQKDLADKYGVTYQAVSKWENGINLPEVSLIREMSKDFNISVEDILDGKETIKPKEKKLLKLISVSLITIVIIGLTILFILKNIKNDSFEFKTISTACSEFKVNGSIAYDKDKSSIYISHIDYCGGDDEETYNEITCNLYENDNNTNTLINSCKAKSNITLENYLKDIELKIDNYFQSCKNYKDNSLYLEITAKDNNNKIITYKVPLKLNENCQ